MTAVTVATALAVPAASASASASAGDAASGYLVYGSRNGDAVITVHSSGQWDLRMMRPSSGLVAVGLVALGVSDYSYSAFAFPAGDTAGVWFDGGGGGGGSGSWVTGRPRWLDVGHVDLAAGRYRVTLVTRQPAKLQLIPPGGGAELRPVPADRATEAGFAQQTVLDPSQAEVAHQSLDFSVPAHAHQVALVAATRWTGDSTVAYDDLCYTAGTTHEAPCLGDPQWAATRGIDPDGTNDTWSYRELYVQQADATGPGTANFYFAVKGEVQRRTIIAIAFP